MRVLVDNYRHTHSHSWIITHTRARNGYIIRVYTLQFVKTLPDVHRPLDVRIIESFGIGFLIVPKQTRAPVERYIRSYRLGARARVWAYYTLYAVFSERNEWRAIVAIGTHGCSVITKATSDARRRVREVVRRVRRRETWNWPSPGTLWCSSSSWPFWP